ncbi:adenylosuccinate lyase [Candidatus Nomurabacteria bacterium RIFCSPHIGHO2_02_FULL_42_19]|uniref:Adenylosuccinate lyase n=1 Tax=Candidatus Nomurabacteria bacterium RIFCSPHIGHO2_02_FULL_42_19 TaxID=1801756 RepID=A0A1F6W2B0_9BACT|nr:MAG: adenylosuccinate lyase [Candidatus Nomurabacteria bacterium RIFCSPHIGHO2_02_FULL_42_19]
MIQGAINPLDGRYFEKTRALAPYFSEQALMKYRVLTECEYLIALSETKGIGIRKLSEREKIIIRNLYKNFSLKDAQMISNIELKGYKNIKATNHDFKAIEYFIKEKLGKTSLKNVLEFVHFGLTTWDATNIAYALMLSDSLEHVLIPEINKTVRELDSLTKKYKNLPMLARTHGQPASPTTFGKEIKVFVTRIEKRIEELENTKIEAKLNGASGNYNALYVAYPKIDWIKFSRKFIESFNKTRTLKLAPNLITTQIECYDSFIAVFDTLRRINTVLLDFNQDMWRYISDDWVGQKPKAGEVGSSTMPHKINPWFLENSEGNLGTANALFEFFARKLPISRLQRDLSDSTVLRSIGTAFGHSLIGYKYLNNQLGRLVVNKEKMLEDLNYHPEIITEAIQTILRREGVAMSYEKLKELSRGKQLKLTDIHKFINMLEVNDKVKKELLKITPQNYTGLASKLAS